MKLNIDKNTIVISEFGSELKQYQVLQFKFFGYTFFNNKYTKDSSDVEVDIRKIISFLDHENIEVELSPNINLLLKDLDNKRSKQANIYTLGRKIKEGNINRDSLNEFTNFLDALPRKLKAHQIKAAFHLYSIKNGANFSVPGSGKTSVVLSVYEKLRLEEICNTLFVVGPTSCFQPWQNEFRETLGRKPKTAILAGGDKNIRKLEYYGSNSTSSELYLATYQTIMNDCEDAVNFLEHFWIKTFFVIDEAHYIKRLGGAWANALLQISEHAQFRCILTGTPIPKSYTDLFNQFDFLWPKEKILTEENKIQIKLWEEQGEHNAVKNLLDEKIGPIFYRVRKQDLGLKPAIFHDPFVIQMNPYEYKIYELIKAKIHEISRDDFIENEELLSNLWKGRMIRLRQSISYPKLLISAIDNYDEDLVSDNSELANMITNYDDLEITGKLDFLTKMVIKFHKRGEKVLIWSNFIGTLELIKTHFSTLNLWSELIYGKTPRNDNYDELSDELTREKIRDIFVDPKSGLNILIANPAACAESISLHKTCFHAIYFDLSYNCAQYLQSLDRIHRVGGSETKTANYYFLQYASSIDQDIKRNLEIKAKKMYNIIEQDYEIYDLDMFEETADDIVAYKRLFHQI